MGETETDRERKGHIGKVGETETEKETYRVGRERET